MLTVVLSLPPSQLSPNARVHWRALAAAKAKYREESKVSAMVAVAELDEWEDAGFPWREASIELRWFAKTKAFPDPDNALATAKSAIDGLMDAGVLADDRDVTYLPVRRDKDAAFPRLEIVIEPLGGSE